MFKNLKIKKFIENIDPCYKIHKDKEWSSLWTTQELWIPKYYKDDKDKSDIYFKYYLISKYNFRPNIYIISLLHEIGHLKTETQKLSDERAIQYAMLEWQYENQFIDELQYYYNYFEIPAERLATRWAINYYKRHQKQIEKMIK